MFEGAHVTHTDKRRTTGCREIMRQPAKTLPGGLFHTAVGILLYSYYMLSILTRRYIIFKLQKMYFSVPQCLMQVTKYHSIVSCWLQGR